MQIPQEIFDLYYDTCDDFLTTNNFAVTCTLSYPATRVDCQNCVFDPLTGQSANIYQSGGPISFTVGQCPYCNGTGFVSSVTTENILMRVYYEKRGWVKMPIPINLPEGSVQTIGHMSDLPKILKCTQIQLHSEIAGQGTFLYTLAGEPIPHGFKRNKYFLALWKRK